MFYSNWLLMLYAEHSYINSSLLIPNSTLI